MPSPHPTWPVALDRYKRFREKKHIGDRFRREELRVLNKAASRLEQTRGPHDLTEEDVLGFFLSLRNDGLATKTQAQYGTALRGLFKYLGVPAAQWLPTFPATATGTEGRYLSDEERAQLWSLGCITPEDELILALGLGAGWRRSDVVRARLEDFHPSAEAPRTVFVHGKGEKYRPRQLELHPRIRETMPRFLVYRTALVARSVHNRPGVVDPQTLFVAFSWHRGLNPLGLSAYDKHVAAIYHRAGVDPGGWPSHNLRRTWADNRLDALTKFYEAKGMSPAMTLEMALRQVCWEGRWADEKTLRQSYLKRRMAPTEQAWALTKL